MNESEIVRLYREENKSTYEISKVFKTYPNKIRRVLKKHGVQLKDKSQAQKNALSNGSAKIPTAGKTRTSEEKLKISYGLKKSWDSMDEEKKKLYIKRAKDRWDNMPDEAKERMKWNGIKAIQMASKEGSKLERYIKERLIAEGYKVLIHQKNILPNKDLEVDLYLPEKKTIIEVDGPSHFLPIWGEQKLQKQMQSDQDKTGLALSKGFRIIRIKHMKNNLCLSAREDLRIKIIDLLNSIESSKTKYIELEA
jgi:very-short-patch-repair endonuclease